MNTINTNSTDTNTKKVIVTTQNKIISGFKREYWEHKKVIIGLPLALGALLIAASLVAIIFFGNVVFNSEDEYSFDFNIGDSSGQVASEQLDFTTGLVPYDGPEIEDIRDSEDDRTRNDFHQEHHSDLKSKGAEMTALGILAAFITIAWVAGLHYLLNTLNTDRKDKSVLFWKSLPLSETQNVLTKLCMGTVGFVAVAIVVAWAVSFVLFAMGLVGAFLVGEWHLTENAYSLSIMGKSILFPIHSLIFGLLWGAPIFTYTLMISAIAKRAPFVWLVGPPIALVLVETIVFKSGVISGFIISHMPFQIFGATMELSNIGSVLQFFIVENGASFVFGLLLSVVFTVTAIWFRNNRFEV